MLFNSIDFGIFFLITVILYFIFPSRYKWICLLISSIVFYIWGNPAFVLFPSVLSLITFVSGIQIERSQSPLLKKRIFIGTVVLQILVLIFFKYVNFFTDSYFDLLNLVRISWLGVGKELPNSLLMEIVAPLGISYIIFQSIGYLIEIKKGNKSAERHLGHFATYLFYFPKMMSGPVERAHNFLPQLKINIQFDPVKVSEGLKLMVWGFFKKLVIADRLIIYVDAVYSNSSHHGGKTLALASFFFTVQLYADFSGYTDIARGLSKVLGIDLMENFNRPFFSTTVTEFWRRWHMSLSTWFNEYFYNPLAITTRNWGDKGIVFTTIFTFTVIGLWHGANWTFVIFGLLHGLLISSELLTRKTRKKLKKKIPSFLSRLIETGFTFIFICFTFIFIKATDVNHALDIVSRIFAFDGEIFYENPALMIYSFFGIMILFAIEFKSEYLKNTLQISNHSNWFIRNLHYALLIILILAIGVFDGGQFIYFKF